MKPTLKITAALLVTAIAGAGWMALPTTAQTMDHSGHDMTGMESPATIAFMEANAKMHADMGMEFTGNPDVDFIKGMVPHHQGAVDMARIVLEHGTDPEVKAFAQGVIDAQEAEIAWMNAWLAKNGQ